MLEVRWYLVVTLGLCLKSQNSTIVNTLPTESNPRQVLGTPLTAVGGWFIPYLEKRYRSGKARCGECHRADYDEPGEIERNQHLSNQRSNEFASIYT
jgi:hypothetical protein